jgi:hypothetical protein
MNDAAPASAPRPLQVAAAVTLLQAAVFLSLTIAQLATFSSERAAMNWTTVVGFFLWALMLGVAGWQVVRGSSWARSPIVMAQIIHVGVAWSFVQGDPADWQKAVAWFIVAAAVVILVGFFRRSSLQYLAADV